MIQRIQSVWLLLAAIFAVVSLNQPFFTGVPGTALSQPMAEFKGSSDIFVTILTVVVAAVSFVAIFMFKNRGKQIGMVVFDLVLSILLIAVYFMKTQQQMLGNVSIQAIFVLVIPIFLLFAIRGIARDRKLIKSVDRLRG